MFRGEELRRIAQLAIGRRRFLPVGNFESGVSGGERLRGLLDLDFVPRGRVEVRCGRENGQDYYEIDVDRLHP